MEKRWNLSQSIFGIAMLTAILLLVPLIAMQFNTGVTWSAGDFTVAGIVLFITGTSFTLVFRHATNVVYKVATVLAVGSTFMMIWADLAVGLIGAGPGAVNLMYVGVVAIGAVGVTLSRFNATGLQRTMFAMAAGTVVIACVALLVNGPAFEESSVGEIIMVNTFFASLFVVSGILFRFATRK